MAFSNINFQLSSKESRESAKHNAHKADSEGGNSSTERLPLIRTTQKTSDRDVNCKGTSKSILNLPELSRSRVQLQPIFGGEPHGNLSATQPTVKTEDTTEGVAINRFGSMFSTSSSEASSWLDFITKNHNTAEQFSTKSKLVEQASDAPMEEDIYEESKALKRWDYWMQDKKKTQNHISKQIGRAPWDLLMQQSDKYREVVEKKMLHCYSQIPEPDKWRGCPGLWKPQLRIKNYKTQAQYCLVKTKLESGEKPEIVRIGLATAIKKEKGLIPEGVVPEEWEKEDKKRKREKEKYSRKSSPCEDEHTGDSYSIEMDGLAVVGVKIFDKGRQKQNSIKSPNIPKIIEPEIQAKEEQPTCSDYRKSVFCLAIEDEEIKYEIGSDYYQDPEKMFVWNIDFGVNMAGTIAEKVLRVENRGTMSVKYDWLPTIYKKKPSLNALQPKSYEPWFFFNKNSGYFLPGQIYNLKFYFQARASGIRKETWLLKTHPPLSKDTEFASILLSGVATEEFSNETKALDSYLNRRVAESIVSMILKIILYNVVEHSSGLREIEYRSIFSEKQLFEYYNQQHYYHPNLVKELKEVFNKIPNKSVVEWDLSLPSLCRVINTYQNDNERSLYLREVANKSLALLRPSYLIVRNQKKHRMVYDILCKMTNSMEEDYVYLKYSVSDKVQEPATSFHVEETGEGSAVSTENGGEEMEEGVSKLEILDIKPINYMFFQTMFYLKVYHRACEAVEHIAGVIETAKLFEPWNEVIFTREKRPPKGEGSPVAEVCHKKKPKIKMQVKIPECF